jgi:hypothetical protein
VSVISTTGGRPDGQTRVMRRRLRAAAMLGVELLLILPGVAVLIAQRVYFAFGTSFSLIWPAAAAAVGAILLVIGIATWKPKSAEKPE